MANSSETSKVMLPCPTCGKPLAAEGVSLRELLRCAVCRQRFYASGESLHPKTSRRALASYVLALASIFVPCFFLLPAIVLGIAALRDIHRSQGRVVGTGAALCGVIVAVILSVSQTFVIVTLVWTIATARMK